MKFSVWKIDSSRVSGHDVFGLFRPFAIPVLVIMMVSGCSPDEPVPYGLDIPAWMPQMDIPADNQLTEARVQLGRKLFYEPLLSVDSTVSCGTCHTPERAFSENRAVSEGVNGALGFRNAPTLANIGYATSFFHDGGVPTLELQAQQPVFSETEMNFTIAGFLERIANDPEYIQLFDEAYGRAPDAFGISRALASFQRTFISSRSRFDRFYYEGDEQALNEAEQRGMEVFFSAETQCATCHAPPLFTDLEFYNIGLYEVYADSGRARITRLSGDRGKFKTPTLRNIALTAPYMHNGSMAELSEVVAHFNMGGVGHPLQSGNVKPLGLSPQEQEDLIAFLHSLTDESFVQNPDLRPIE